MARFIPKIDLSAIQNCGERLVAKALSEQLPHDCVVYHSYPWLRRFCGPGVKGGHLVEGEVDFVIVHPKYGIAILEVKGGSIEYNVKEGEWIRMQDQGPVTIKNPFRQAEKNLHAIKDILLKHNDFRNKSSIPFAYGYAVVFPSCQFVGELPPYIDQSILFTAKDLQSFGKRIDDMFAAWSRSLNSAHIKASDQEAIQEALSPMFHLTPVLWRTIEDQEERIKKLTADQERLLNFLQGHNRVAIEGVAGSGKTILALSQAQRFAREGKKTALICYNRQLADWLGKQIPDRFLSFIDVDTFHGFCKKCASLANVTYSPPRQNDDSEIKDKFYKYTAAELLDKSLSLISNSMKYDAIVVDEGQDFHDVWWVVLEKLYQKSMGNQPLFIFFDPKQSLYLDQIALPPNIGKPYLLSENCRNTRKIASYCSNILSVKISLKEDAPEGSSPLELQGSTWDDVIRLAKQQIQDWCLRERGALKPNQVAILMLNEWRKWPSEFGNIRIVSDMDAWRNGKGVLLTTCRKFKGLEADAIVIAGVPVPGMSRLYGKPDHYVASSRAKHLLKVIYYSSNW